MGVEESTKKEFSKARKEVESKFQDVSKEVDLKIKELLGKTYKQFEKTHGANSRQTSK